MADLKPTSHRRTASQESLRNDNYDTLFQTSNIPVDPYDVFDPQSSEDEGKTRRPAPSSKGRVGDTIPMASVSTTARESPEDEEAASGWPIYLKIFGDPRKPRYRDIEAGPAISTSSALRKDKPNNVQMYEIMHNWTLEERDDELIAQVNVVDHPKGSRSADTSREDRIEGHVIWLHAEESRPSLKQLQNLFQTYLAPGLPYHLEQTALSVLARIRASRERKTVGGKFLSAGPMRYDGRLSFGGDNDHPCTFFSFPYFAVGKDIARTNSRAGATTDANMQPPNGLRAHAEDDDTHPQRTLLQSRYHLESTELRDKKQSITSLSPQNVLDSIRLPKGRPHFEGKKWTELIYVPQFWALSVSGDKMITSAPLSDPSLRSFVLPTKSFQMQTSDAHHNPFVIKINLEYDDKQESFLYPTGQCDWYFGLLNKERRIVETLGHRKGKVDSPKYKLYSMNQSKSPGLASPIVITGDNWLEHLAAHRGSNQLELRMACDVPPIKITAHSSVKSADAQTNGEGTSISAAPGLLRPDTLSPNSPTQPSRNSHRHLSPPKHQRDDSRSSVQSSTATRVTTEQLDWSVPFLQWPFEEDKKLGPYKSAKKRVQVWLDYVLRPLPPGLNDLSIRPQSMAIKHRTQHPVLSRDQMIILTNLARLKCEVEQIIPGIKDGSVDGEHALNETLSLLDSYYDLGLKSPEDDAAIGEAKMIMRPLLELMELEDLDLQLDDRGEANSKVQVRRNPVLSGSHIQSTVSKDTGKGRSIKSMQPSNVLLKGYINTLIEIARYLLKLFVPEKPIDDGQGDEAWDANTHRLLGIYWSLQGSIICSAYEGRLHAEELAALLRALERIIFLAEAVHKGVRRAKRGSEAQIHATDVYELFAGIVIPAPLPRALEDLFICLYGVHEYASARQPGASPEIATFQQTVGRHLQKVENNIRRAQDYLIAGAEYGALEASLGPVVTPEAILLLLLERLSRGVYRDGTVNVLEIYEKLVEKIASSVEFDARRRLLLDINRISEELDIIHDILNQQKDFFKVYKALLDPDEFERSSVRRVTRFQHEKKSIQRNIKAMEERIRDCQDLMKRTQTLAAQNLQLVETYQDDKNKVLMIFTFVTIVFLPLSFVTGFFGMNVVGISGTMYTVRHFWVIAIPVTVGVGILCFIMMYWAKIARLWKRHSQKLRKKVHKD